VRAALPTGLLIATLAASTASAAEPPAVGWWRGVNADGTRVSFAVARYDAGRVVTGIVVGCDRQGRVYDEALALTDVQFSVAQGAPSAYAGYPLRRSGRIDLRGRSISPPSGTNYSDYFGLPPFHARLSGRTGRVRIRSGPGLRTNQCAPNEPTKPGTTIDVSYAGPDSVRPGVWRVRGLQPFGDAADYAAGSLEVQPSGVVGSFRGIVLGPSTVPPGGRPNPLISPWPLPCIGSRTAASYLFGGNNLLAVGLIGTDRSLRTPGADASHPGPFVSTDGRFTSPAAYEGSYFITEGPGEFGCIDVSIPLRAELKQEAPIVVGATEGRRAPRAPAPPPEPEIPQQPLDYVALGDSYSSGEGVPPFDPETDTSENRCHRSTAAYSRVFEPSGWRLRRRFLACSGAVTDNVGLLDEATGQIGGVTQYGSEQSVQLARLTPAQWAETDLVTMTIGGNDAQFARVLTQCLVFRCHRGRRARRITTHIARAVPPKLRSTYAGIARSAPNASVFVLGYPQLFPSRPRRGCAIGKRPVSRAKQVFLRARGAQLNRAIRRVARAAGFHYVDAERTFRGHEPCGPKSEWIHSIVLRGGVVFSFHPNGFGQRAYARALERYVGCLADHEWTMAASGVPANPGARRVPPACA
jgi:lysophospholipase L1-like esterase